MVFPSQLQEEHQKALLRRDFQLQSLGLQARLQRKLWSQERTLLVQESQHLKQALLLLSLKLRCFLKQWRLGCKKDAEWKDILEVKCPTAVRLWTYLIYFDKILSHFSVRLNTLVLVYSYYK